jgi:hypothetical protein
MSHDACAVVVSARPCPQRAEYLVSTLVDGLEVCPAHVLWAQDRLRSDGERSDYTYDSITRTDLLHPDEWPSGFAGLRTTSQAADHWQVEAVTYRAYVSRGYAPAPAQMRDPRTGSRLHDADAVRAAFNRRAGSGARTDLRPR